MTDRESAADIDLLLSRLERYIAYSLDGISYSVATGQTEPICFSCGVQLHIKSRGRRKYCASCGCYLPEIIYDTTFTESVNPMRIVKPPPLPTVNTH